MLYVSPLCEGHWLNFLNKINYTLNVLNGSHLGCTGGANCSLGKTAHHSAKGMERWVLWEGGHWLGCPYAHWLGQQTGRDGRQTVTMKGRALPLGLHWPCDSSSAATWPQHHLGDCDVRLCFSQQDLRFLWLPKDTKFERHSLAWSSPEKRSGLDYT